MNPFLKFWLIFIVLVVMTGFVAACLQWPWLIFALLLIWLALWALKGFLTIMAALFRIALDWVRR